MIHEISVVLIYATVVMLLVNHYEKRVDRLEDRIIDLENKMDKKGNKDGKRKSDG